LFTACAGGSPANPEEVPVHRRLVLILALLSAAAAAGPAGASGGSVGSIDVMRLDTAEAPPVGFTATGAFLGGGRLATGDWAEIGSGRQFVGTDRNSTVHVTTRQTNAAGSFEIRWDAQFSANHEVENCTLLHGTGAYAGIHGTGTWTVDVPGDGLIHIECTADIHYD